MTAAKAPPRPAHRPSRRAQVIDTAMKLFATVSYDDVTVGDIAIAADMTPAAVYYHFAGKEQILLEGCREFGAELVAIARQTVLDEAIPSTMVTALLEHVRSRSTFATVYFLGSAGLNPALEAHRKGVRDELSLVCSESARLVRPKLSRADAGVVGAALVSLLEVTSVSALSRDHSHKLLGVKGLTVAVKVLADRIVGLSV